jgi:predicted membrane protein
MTHHHLRPQETIDVGRLLLGAVVLALGTLLLLDAAGTLDAGDAIERWWPAVLIAAGLVTLADRRRSTTAPFILVSAGAFLLLVTTDVIGGDPAAYVWPVILIAAGLAILTRRTAPAAAEIGEGDVVRASGIFSGPEVATTSQSFRRASLVGLFGGVILDLRDARPAPEGAVVTATAVFGGVQILVPRGWRIATASTPIFGGVEDKTVRAAPLPDDAPTLRVDALAVFGGVEITHEK